MSMLNEEYVAHLQAFFDENNTIDAPTIFTALKRKIRDNHIPIFPNASAEWFKAVTYAYEVFMPIQQEVSDLYQRYAEMITISEQLPRDIELLEQPWHLGTEILPPGSEIMPPGLDVYSTEMLEQEGLDLGKRLMELARAKVLKEEMRRRLKHAISVIAESSLWKLLDSIAKDPLIAEEFA